MLSRKESFQNHSMNCPACQAAVSRRSRRRSFLDYSWCLLGVLPWRCMSCDTRFYARPAPLRAIAYARCRLCGNRELEPVSPTRVSGMFSFIARRIGIPAVRCAPCRNNFHSLRPILPREQLEDTPAPERSKDVGTVESSSSAARPNSSTLRRPLG